MNRASKVRVIRLLIRNGKYDWKTAIEHTAEKITDYPQVLLWR